MPDPSLKTLWDYLGLSPVGMGLLFDGSEILVDDGHREWLTEMVKGSVEGGECEEAELLYSCSDATKDATAFHASCNGKAATVVLVRSTNGYVFGGYNPVSWRSHGFGDYDIADGAFIFSVVNPAGTEPTKYEKKAGEDGIYQSSSIGPMFRNDLCCWDSRGQSDTWFPESYVDITGRGRATFTGDSRSFTIDRLEVWNIV